jgi:hypothetical protein
VTEHFYVIAATEPDRDLALAEADALAPGACPSPHIWVSERSVDAGRAGFMVLAAESIWRGREFGELLRLLEERPIEAHGFAIDSRKYPRRGGPVRQELCHQIGKRLVGHPNLDEPAVEFALVLDEGEYYFGRITSRQSTDWHARIHKPFTFSAAIGPRVARAAVNIASPEPSVLIDPCCGSGTIVIEAASLGHTVAGFDRAPEMPARARHNARHFGLDALLGVGDARTLAGDFDILVSNLPYDLFSPIPDGFYDDVLANLPDLAPRMALFAARDLSPRIAAAGLDLEALILQPTHSITRHLHLIGQE